jgi:cobalt-zinc-cadmium efflux system outer membrane protein
MRRLLFAACFAGATVTSLAAQQTERPRVDDSVVDSLRLSRAQAIAQALSRNTQLDIAREQTAQARARRVQGVAIPDPALTAATDEQSRFFGFNRGGTRPVEVGLAVPFPDKFRLQNRIGVADIKANEQNYRLQQQLVAFDASQSYDQLLLALRRRGDLTDALALSQDFLKRTQARFDAGTAAKVDVIKARVEVAGATNDLIASEREIANAQTALNRAIGRVSFAPIVPTDSLDVPPPLPDSANAEAEALSERPELAVIAHEIRGARATTSLAREFWLPDITFGVSKDYLQPNAAVFSTGIALPLPFLFWQHTKGEIAESSHRERELTATERDLRAQVVQDVRSAYANASTAMRQALFLREDLLPAAREAYRVASTSYQLGGASALEVIDSRRALLDAQSQLAEALANANTARADLDRALGRSPLGTGMQTR